MLAIPRRHSHFIFAVIQAGELRLKLSAGREIPRGHVSGLLSDRCQVEYQFHNLILRPHSRSELLIGLFVGCSLNSARNAT